MFRFQRNIKKIHSSLSKLYAGKYQSHGTYEVTSIFQALDPNLEIT